MLHLNIDNKLVFETYDQYKKVLGNFEAYTMEDALGKVKELYPDWKYLICPERFKGIL